LGRGRSPQTVPMVRAYNVYNCWVTQSEEPYLVRWVVFCEAVEWSGADMQIDIISDGLNHVPILTMSVAVTVEANYAHEW